MGQNGRSLHGILTMMICLVVAVPAFAGTWVIQTVDSAGDVGNPLSMAYDPLDRNPSIAYRDRTNNNAKFAHWNGTTWDREVIGPMGNAYLALAYNPLTGKAAVAYTAQVAKAKYSLVLATRRAPGVWDKEVVDIQLPNHLSLAFDGTGVPGIAYIIPVRKSPSIVYYTWKTTGGTWPKQTVATGWFEQVSLAYDPTNNYPAIAYNPHDSTEYCVKLALQTAGGGWAVETAECGPWQQGPNGPYPGYGWGNFPSLAYSPVPNAPSIATTGGGSAAWPRYSRRVGQNNWPTETIDPAAPESFWPSLAFTGAGVPYLSYVSGGTVAEELRVAHFDGAAWVIETVEAADLGYLSSLALDSAGLPSVAYRDAAALDLKFARYTP